MRDLFQSQDADFFAGPTEEGTTFDAAMETDETFRVDFSKDAMEFDLGFEDEDDLDTEFSDVIVIGDVEVRVEETAEGVVVTARNNDEIQRVVVRHGEPGPQGEPGPAGADGKDGERGPQGEPGPAPVKGEDYWTPEDVQYMVTEAASAVRRSLTGVVLYEGGIDPATGKALTNQDSITLSDSAANYDLFDIYYVSNDTHWSYTKVYAPNGKNVMLMGALVGNTDVFLKLKCILINGKSVTVSYTTDATKYFAGEGALIGGTLTRDKKFLTITKIVGHKNPA